MQNTASLKLPCASCAALEIFILETAQLAYSRKCYAFFFPLCLELSNEEIFCGGGEDKCRNSFCLMASNKGQSEPVGTSEKQGKRSFSLSIRYEARLAGACPCLKP